jgi:hypothetical protein
VTDHAVAEGRHGSFNERLVVGGYDQEDSFRAKLFGFPPDAL